MDPQEQQRRAFVAFQAMQRQMAEKAKNVDWSSMMNGDALKDPKNLKVQFGPMLTEEQFKEYCTDNGIKNPAVVKNPK
jgi:hypothetical protein